MAAAGFLMKRTQTSSIFNLGCGFLLATLLVTCVLLVLNGLIVSNVFNASRESLPEFLQDRRWSQAIVFLAPVLMLVVQWWAYDVAVDWLWPTRSKRSGG